MTEPLRLAPAPLFLSTFKSRLGTVVLLEDRLAFVAPKRRAGAAFGAIGMLLTQRSATNAAPARAAEGGDGVTTVPLAELQAIERGTQGLNKDVLVVRGPATELKLGVRYDEWAPAIERAAIAAGRRSTVGDDRIEFA
ncbi:MAG TPA: hypothetical protein VFU14_03970 [Acidimicrobiales bacterium]|nr:hypothetical protein [Acidimicrobiales bacterium]